jgi:hypothetical protein
MANDLVTEDDPDRELAQLVEDAVSYINENVSTSILKASLRIGEYVLCSIFDDDIERASARNPYKEASYRALCRHPAMPLSPCRLSEMVRIAAQFKYFRRQNLPIDDLNYTHHLYLAQIRNNERKISLVLDIHDKSLSTRDVKKRVAEIRASRAKVEKVIRSSKIGSTKVNDKTFDNFDESIVPKLCVGLQSNEIRKIPFNFAVLSRKSRRQLAYARNKVGELIESLLDVTSSYMLLRDVIEAIEETKEFE